MQGTCETIPYMRRDHVMFFIQKGLWNRGYPLDFSSDGHGPEGPKRVLTLNDRRVGGNQSGRNTEMIYKSARPKEIYLNII